MIVFLLLAAGLMCLGHGWATEQAVYHYSPEKAELTGVLTQKIFYGPPGYGEDPKHDKKEHVYVLKLERPIRVIATDKDSQNEGHDNIRELQVDYTGKILLKNFLKKKVRIRGTLRSAEIGHDHTDVLITPDEILPDDRPPAKTR